MERDEPQALHERLCAYALDESDPQERRALEAELARSEDLRAELERIRATFALVRRGLAGHAEELSAEALASVLARGRAEAGRPRGWRRLVGAPLGRVAAAFALVALGLVVWAQWERRAPAPGRPFTYGFEGNAASVVELAQVDEAAPAANEPLLLDAELEALPSTGTHARRAEAGLGEPEKRFASSARAKEDEVLHELADLAYAGSPAPVPAAGESEGRFGNRTGGRRDLRAQGGTGGEFRGPGDTLPPATAGASKDAAGGPSSLAKAEARPGSDERLRQEQPQSSPERRLEAGLRLDAPSAPPDGVTSNDSYFLGRSDERDAVEETREKLRGLGYVDASEGAEAADDARPWSELDEAQRARRLERELERVLRGCAPLPDETPQAMFFRFWGDNPFVLSRLDALATFAADVDTASWPLARGYLSRGLVPPREAIRTEEVLNSFRPHLEPPRQGTFAVHAELAPSRFGGDSARWMLSVALKGREVERSERKPLALTFVLDVSGSMDREDRLGLVKHALRLLVAQLDARDRIGLVVFSNEARVVLPPTAASERAAIEAALEPVRAGGSTNAGAGLTLGYQLALAGLDAQATNRVVLLSDGVANTGETDQARILEQVARQRAQGIYLNTIGVGMGNHDDAFLEQLADRGDGVASYVDGEREARRVLVDGFVGTLETIARDVKLQVELDPRFVERWRLLGYENRAVADLDFRNDAVDAGEVGAGHAVVALIELELPRGLPRDASPLASVRVRWKPPFAPGLPEAERSARERAEELEVVVDATHATSWEGASAGYRRLVLAAQLAEHLRGSVHAQEDALEDLASEARAELARGPTDAPFAELVDLLERNLTALQAAREPCDAVCGAVRELRDLRVRAAELERLHAEEDARQLEELRRRDASVEARIGALVRERIAGGR